MHLCPYLQQPEKKHPCRTNYNTIHTDMKRILKYSLLAASCLMAALMTSSCKGGNRKALLPNISGKAGEVLVVMEKADWESAPGLVIRDSLTAECPYLPQKEPLYNLINVTPSNFTQMFQIHRNIIICRIASDVNKPEIVFRTDKWAKPQLVISVSASSQEGAEELLKANMHKILNTIEQVERNRIIANTRQYQERKLAEVVKTFTGGNMVFPSGYSLKKKTGDFIWISYETTYVQQGIFIWRYPTEHTVAELGSEALVAKRNSVLKDNVPGMRDGSYMTTSDILKPEIRYSSYGGRKFAQMRGFWDVHGDFMGGPFVSHTFYTPDRLELICLEAYVYAPKFDKRHYLRQVESLLYSFEWDKNNE